MTQAAGMAGRAGRRLRVAIVTDKAGWHGPQLRRAFKARGVETRYVSLVRCGVDLSRGVQGIVMPSFERQLPDGVFVRAVPGGTLEQVVLRLDFLHALRELEVPVYNEPRAIEKSVDKAMTSLLLHRAGVPTPPTWVTESASVARGIVMRECAAGHEVVVKPLFGSQGNGLRRLQAGMDIPEAAAVDGVWYLQRFVRTPAAARGNFRDWRVLVVGHAAVAAMLRHGRTWINNVAKGARCEAADPGGALGDLAVAATRAVGMDYAGVDVMQDDRGRLLVIEVNSIPAWRGLQGVTSLNIAERLVQDFVVRKLSPRLAAVG
jgi:tetrahydromethanopterin:alpha-L-glutamate ligase